MSPTEYELRSDFRVIFFEILVPLAVQLRVPGVRRHWQAVLSTQEGEAAFGRCFYRMSRERRSIGESVRDAIATADRDVLHLKNALYTRIGRDQALITDLIGRTITNGNEQCPYWDGFAYDAPPRDKDRAGVREAGA